LDSQDFAQKAMDAVRGSSSIQRAATRFDRSPPRAYSPARDLPHALVAVYGLDSTPLTAMVCDLAPSVVQAKPRP